MPGPQETTDLGLPDAADQAPGVAASSLLCPEPMDAPGHGIPRAKRALDLALATLALVVSAPVMLIAAGLVRLSSPGPVLFRQVRIGRGERPFTMLKLRTMYVDSDERASREFNTCELLGEAEPDSDGVFKLENDPRIVPGGRFLRRYSIDELPQLLNVLRGEMSLVGPRPSLPWEVERYDPDTGRRLRVRPGMTGLWQVSGRSNLSWSEAIRLDLYYVDNWSMMQDLSILAKTVGAVFGSPGAY